MAYDFKYIRTGTGELSGPSMIWQTEQALTQIGTYADDANTKADGAQETANTALNKANEAADAAERAQNTADTAQAAASHAQDTADAAQVVAGDAQNIANEALEAAQTGTADAAKAQATADKAQASADAAQTAADTAQLTADMAQNAADKAQGAADAAQETATIALDTANSSQSSANVAQDTADNALLVSQSTQQAFYEHVREYTLQIAQALGEFEADSTTVNFDNFTSPVKLYITSPDALITIPDGQVNAPFYLWNFTTDDRSSTAQFVYAANGLAYSRYGTITQDSLIPGADTYELENNTNVAILTCTGVASGMTITKHGTLTNTWTASDTHDSYITGTWNIKGIANGTIDLNGVTIASLSDTGFYPTGQQQLQEDNTSFVIEDMTYSADDGLTIKVTVQWLNINSQISWDSWKAAAGTGGTVAADGVTIRYNSASSLQAKDIAIDGDESDLASARGQVGDAKEMPNLDFNTLTTPGNYRITGNPTNGPSLPLNISGASIGSLIVAGTLGQHGRIFQIMISGSAVTWRTIQNSTGATWGAWQQLLSGNKVGDGIRVTNGTISVPEYEGATASTAGTSGLVPPAAAGQANYALCGGGEWRDIATLVAGDFVPDSRRVIAGTGLTGGGPLSADVTLAAKLTNSVSLTDSTTAASATAVKSAYDRGTAGVTAAGEAKTTAKNALTVANSKQPNLGFTPVQQGGGSGQDNSKIYIGHGTNGLKAQIGTTDLGYIVTTAAGTTKAANSASADRAQVAGSAETLFVTGWGNTKWGSTPYGQSPLYVWCLPSGGSDMMPCSPGVLSTGAANWCVYTPNVAVGDNSAVPQGGTWKYFSWGYDKAVNGVVAGGTNIPNRFIAIRVS